MNGLMNEFHWKDTVAVKSQIDLVSNSNFEKFCLFFFPLDNFLILFVAQFLHLKIGKIIARSHIATKLKEVNF